MWRLAVVAAVLVVAGLLGRAVLVDHEPAAAKGKLIVTRSPDSLAPRNAPAHWLPPEDWVYNHWLPFDEERLYAVLGITRQDLWQQLRDDRRTLAQLAAERGWRPKRLAAALVDPAQGDVKLLRGRAKRVITQGHLAQHIFFHSLHQFAVPSEAPELFGVTDARFRELRRAELSPLTVARLHGRSPGKVEALAIAVLRERVAAGVESGAMPAAQGRRLLRRQLTQLPRWLGQARYNGPPPTTKGALVSLPKDYASNPSISADGRHVAYESYRQKLPLAVKLGEIAVMRADLRTGRSELVSPPGDNGPVSNYNPSISGDGARVTYETSAGNDNFAKRYGRISVLLSDVASGQTVPAARSRREGADSQSDYNPVLAADGRHGAFQALRGGRTAIVVRDLASGRERLAAGGARAGESRFADVFEPGLSADASRVVFTVASGRVGTAAGARSEVRVRDLRRGRTTVVARHGDDAAISPDGRWVAFTGGRSRLLVHDLRTGRTRRLPMRGAHVLDPVVSRGARTVAYTAMRGGRSRVLAWTAAGTKLVGEDASDPSVSADGRRIAFASTATADGARGIFVRDLHGARSRLVSDTKAAYPPAALEKVLAAAKAGGPPAPATVTEPKPPDLRPDEVAVTDNAFFAGQDRPTLQVGVGERVTWTWRSRQSHAVTVADGPERFATAAQTGARFSYSFSRPGTYSLVCSLHAPGMRMTVVVSSG
jgi:Tol biopolymer transport system component